MDKVILANNRRQPECVFKDMCSGHPKVYFGSIVEGSGGEGGGGRGGMHGGSSGFSH